MSTEKIKEALTDYWGVECPEFEPTCFCCAAWAEFRALESEIARLRAIDDKLGFWLSACVDDHQSCDEFKAAVSGWFESRAERQDSPPTA